ncbi:MAG: HEAT repeat domain-containing protein, partial [Nitrospira sp.]
DDASAIALAAELARHPDPSIRGAAAQAVSVSPDEQALTILQSLLLDQQPLPRLMAAKALRKSNDRAVPILVQGLRDTDEAVRIAAANSLLQQLGKPPAPTRRR